MFVLPRCCRRVEARSSGCLRAKSFKDSSVTIGHAAQRAADVSQFLLGPLQLEHHQPMKVVKGKRISGRRGPQKSTPKRFCDRISGKGATAPAPCWDGCKTFLRTGDLQRIKIESRSHGDEQVEGLGYLVIPQQTGEALFAVSLQYDRYT